MNKVYEITFCRKKGFHKNKTFKMRFNSLSELADYIVNKDSTLTCTRLIEELNWQERKILMAKIVALYTKNN